MSATDSTAPHRWTFLDDIVVSETVPGEITDELYFRFCDEIEASDVRMVFAISTGGNSLTSAQRKRISGVMQKKGVSAVVLTDSRLTRGVVTAVSWLGARAKAFGWNDLEAAIEYSGVGDEYKARLREMAEHFHKTEIRPRR